MSKPQNILNPTLKTKKNKKTIRCDKMKDISLNMKTPKNLKDPRPYLKKGNKSKRKFITLCRKAQIHFYHHTATKIGLQKYHKIKENKIQKILQNKS